MTEDEVRKDWPKMAAKADAFDAMVQAFEVDRYHMSGKELNAQAMAIRLVRNIQSDAIRMMERGDG